MSLNLHSDVPMHSPDETPEHNQKIMVFMSNYDGWFCGIYDCYRQQIACFAGPVFKWNQVRVWYAVEDVEIPEGV